MSNIKERYTRLQPTIKEHYMRFQSWKQNGSEFKVKESTGHTCACCGYEYGGQLLPCVRPEDRPATYHLGRRARERARPLGHGHTLHALLHLATDAATGLLHCRLHQRKAAGEFSASQDVVFRHRHHPAG